MIKLSDNEVIRDAIEIFLVQYFDTIEMAGTVKQEKRKSINYFSVDLNDLKLNDDLEKLHGDLNRYLLDWVKKKGKYFQDYVSMATLTIEYLLPERDGTIQNKFKLVRLFYLPSYFFKSSPGVEKPPRHPIFIWFINQWNNIILRNVLIVSIPASFFITLTFVHCKNDTLFVSRLAKSFEYVNVASGIIASFILGYLINKVLSIRQDKIRRVEEIKKLSNKLTYFRNICFNFLRDYTFWSKDNVYRESFDYGNSIKNVITYEDYFYPNYGNEIEYANFKAIFNDRMSNPIVLLVLQLHMLADDTFIDSGLTYTEFPKNYIYSLSEMEKFSAFIDGNQIWYCCTEGKYFPATFQDSYHIEKILEDMKRINKKYAEKYLTKKSLEKVSLTFQYKIIPTLYRLVKLNEADLPLTVLYFQVSFTLILIFGIILPSLLYVFVGDSKYAFMNIFVVMAVIGHILLSLKFILNSENNLDREEDYF